MARRVLLLVATALLVVPAGVADGKPVGFREVGRLPLLGAPELGASEVDRSGWLILNPVTRRAYEVLESARGTTVIQSFDLDTLQPRRRVVLSGVPVTRPASAGTTSFDAEVVHAVDQQHGRIYLAMSQTQAIDEQLRQIAGVIGLPPDARRPVARLVAIDEAALDRCGGEIGCPFASSFREPVTQERLHAYWLVGMAVTRDFVAAAEPGRLLALFAQPRQGGDTPVADHTLAQWQAPAVGDFAAGEENETAPTAGLSMPGQIQVRQTAAAGPTRRLDACRGTLGSAASGFVDSTHQWGLLVARGGVWTACQSGQDFGGVTAVPFDSRGELDPLGPSLLFPLAQKISGVLADEANDRLLVRSYGGATRLHVFDTASSQFTGAVTVKAHDAYSAALGVHPASGRLYALLPDHTTWDGVAVQGGLQYSDPPSPLTNVRPDLAYPSGYRIQVDPVRNRFFARLGHQFIRTTVDYPGTTADTPAPSEPFYRVFEDRVR